MCGFRVDVMVDPAEVPADVYERKFEMEIKYSLVCFIVVASNCKYGSGNARKITLAAYRLD